jgi:hypothetical protein
MPSGLIEEENDFFRREGSMKLIFFVLFNGWPAGKRPLPRGSG